MNTYMVSLSNPKTKFPEIKSNPGKAHHQNVGSSIGHYTEIISVISLSIYFKLKNYLKRLIDP